MYIYVYINIKNLENYIGNKNQTSQHTHVSVYLLNLPSTRIRSTDPKAIFARLCYPRLARLSDVCLRHEGETHVTRTTDAHGVTSAG